MRINAHIARSRGVCGRKTAAADTVRGAATCAPGRLRRANKRESLRPLLSPRMRQAAGVRGAPRRHSVLTGSTQGITLFSGGPLYEKILRFRGACRRPHHRFHRLCRLQRQAVRHRSSHALCRGRGHRRRGRERRRPARHQLRRMAGAGGMDVPHQADGHPLHGHDALLPLRQGKGGGAHLGISGQLDHGGGLQDREGTRAQRRQSALHLHERLLSPLRRGRAAPPGRIHPAGRPLRAAGLRP